MDERNDSNQRPRYTWPWFVLGAVVLGIVLATIWMTVLVRRTREQRDMTTWQPMPPALHTNPPSGTNAHP